MQGLRTDAQNAQGEQNAGREGSKAGTVDRHAHQRDKKIDHRTWRIAIRQADMVLRRMRDQAEVYHVDRLGRRRRGQNHAAILLGKAANAVWEALREPPATVADAHEWDDRMEENWPRDGGRGRNSTAQAFRRFWSKMCNTSSHRVPRDKDKGATHMSTKVYGESDDLVEFEGDVDGEVNHYSSDEEPILVAFSDGTLATFRYAERGIWKADMLHQGLLFERIDPCHDEDADPHSDVLHFRDGLKWAYSSSQFERVK
jgi:hypothetical protein